MNSKSGGVEHGVCCSLDLFPVQMGDHRCPMDLSVCLRLKGNGKSSNQDLIRTAFTQMHKFELRDWECGQTQEPRQSCSVTEA